jgi:hypothetical protein
MIVEGFVPYTTADSSGRCNGYLMVGGRCGEERASGAAA